MKLLYILVVVCFGYASADQTWNGLEVTWDLSPFNRWAFAGMARQLRSDGTLDATKYTMMENFCTMPNSSFVGRRFRIKTNSVSDPAVSLLFDVNGYIAGIQISIAKTSFNPSNSIRNSQLAVSDGMYVTQTAYFVDPNIVCTTGRNAAQFARDGTGNGLWVQQRTVPVLHTPQIPTTQAQLDGQIASGVSKWTKGKCFFTMGLHYWYNLRKDMNCDDFLPMFLLYNKGNLNAFGWAVETGSTALASPRYEHPTASITFLFMNPTPDCIGTDPRFNNLNTMHIFMTSRPRYNDYC